MDYERDRTDHLSDYFLAALSGTRSGNLTPPDQRYSSLVSIIGPYPSLAIGIFGLLMILHAIVVEISARRRLQNGIRNEISENTTRVR